MTRGADPAGPAPGEFELIERYFARGGRPVRDGSVVVGIGDDAAVLRVPEGADLVAAVDTIVEGRHFPPDSPPRSIGHRALAVNLSDLAAMGAVPKWATIALTMPRADPGWLEAFAAGLLELADRHGVTLVGGDTTRGPLTVSVQILGHVPRGAALLRSGASPGDRLAVTGSLGDAAAGLALLQSSPRAPDEPGRALIRRFEYPTPRIEFGLAARGLASAAMDLSDGLVGDLEKLAAASGLAAEVDVERLPISAELRAVETPSRALEQALAGGDDYELLVAAPASRLQELAAAAAKCGTALTEIGVLREGRGVTWVTGGRPYSPARGGFDHFARP